MRLVTISCQRERGTNSNKSEKWPSNEIYRQGKCSLRRLRHLDYSHTGVRTHLCVVRTPLKELEYNPEQLMKTFSTYEKIRRASQPENSPKVGFSLAKASANNRNYNREKELWSKSKGQSIPKQRMHAEQEIIILIVGSVMLFWSL